MSGSDKIRRGTRRGDEGNGEKLSKNPKFS